MDRKMDACLLGKSTSTNPFVNLFLSVLYKSINFSFGCPLLANSFSVQNLQFPKILPLIPNTHICVKVVLLAKLHNSKNFQSALTVTANATYV